MDDRRRTLLLLPVFAALVGVARADPIPRLRASWREKEARVEVFAPDGRSLVSSGGEGCRLRDAATGEVRRVLAAPPHQIHGARFSPDGRLLLAKVFSDRHAPVGVCDLRVWDAATGEERATFPYVSEGINGVTDHFALSPDGQALAFLDNSERLPMTVETSKMVFDDRFEATIAWNASKGLPRVRIWDVAAWKERATVAGGAPLAFSPDGTTLVTGARDWHDPTARIWDAATGRPRGSFDTGGPWMKPLVFSPDGRSLAIGTPRKQELYELAGGRRRSVADAAGPQRAPVFSSDGRLLFSSGLPWVDPQIGQVWDCTFYDLAASPPRRVGLEAGDLAVAPDGSRYAAVRGTRGTGAPLTVTIHDLPSLREVGRIEVGGLEGAGFSPDGRRLALLVGRHEATRPGEPGRYLRGLELVDPATARVVATIPSPGETWGNYGWKFSPDGSTVAIRYRTGSNVSGPEDPDPIERPMSLELWEVRP